MIQQAPLGLIDKQILWNRLIAVVEEQAQTLQRTAFSTIVRESGDLAAGVFDVRGRMLAQAVTGTPGHINSMALAVGHVLDRYPADVMKPGDVFIHNDPWMGTGHTNDFSVTTPCFRDGKLVAIFACNSHLMDIGGVPRMSGSIDVFMEGLYLPILKIVEGGVVNDTLMELIRANTRLPIETEGDVYSLIACNDVGCERLVETMGEFGIDDLAPVADHIIDASRAAVLANIRALPRGSWSSSLTLDGFDSPLELKAKLTISDDGIHVDYAGSAGMVKQNFNVPFCYTIAYTSYALGCIVARDIPNNAGSLEPRTVSAPPGTVVNALKPAAVVARHLVGLMLPDLVFGCLRQAIPDRVPAEGAGVLWGINVSGPRVSPARHNDSFVVGIVTTGGMGALPVRDGLSATGFPSGVRGGPVEIFESMSTVIVWRKQYRQDSGGAGRQRGGLGQDIEIENGIPEMFELASSYERIIHPAKGFDGGLEGARGVVALSTGRALSGKGRFPVQPGERLIIQSPGGGGLGDPTARDRAAVEADLANELISQDAARSLYGLNVAQAAE
ncbi:hydantoinase B/oxoprolinase family protein [Phreatobacter aquaticus]|uniref:Hydantoinase B/oxoprolinase family protein n=1 Tax=Phreatobacter aquaticus TaxID=2570229 RepID=A0A4D7QGC3_9HYPH|nr:hydantoinase B/oxoprolinase family protein [Phreatobacter aquaticus]QCK84496.1 hydantoinase B/oxoprolinase family protein [Phreatobacter aquaticus]